MLFKNPPLLEVSLATVCLWVPAPLCVGLWVGSADLCLQMGFPQKTNLWRLSPGQYSDSGNGMEPSSPILVGHLMSPGDDFPLLAPSVK